MRRSHESTSREGTGGTEMTRKLPKCMVRYAVRDRDEERTNADVIWRWGAVWMERVRWRARCPSILNVRGSSMVECKAVCTRAAVRGAHHPLPTEIWTVHGPQSAVRVRCVAPLRRSSSRASASGPCDANESRTSREHTPGSWVANAPDSRKCAVVPVASWALA